MLATGYKIEARRDHTEKKKKEEVKIWDKANWDEMQVEKESFIMFWDKTWDNEMRWDRKWDKKREKKRKYKKGKDETKCTHKITFSPLPLVLSLMCFIGMISNCALELPKH